MPLPPDNHEAHDYAERIRERLPRLDAPFANDPPTLADIETMRAKFNELVLALRR